jgi:hypothetical protein
MDETEIKADIGRVSLELDSIVVLLLLVLFLSCPLSVAVCVPFVGCWRGIVF